jgi:hypothetical protein
LRNKIWIGSDKFVEEILTPVDENKFLDEIKARIIQPRVPFEVLIGVVATHYNVSQSTIPINYPNQLP